MYANLRPLLALTATLAALVGLNEFLLEHGALLGQVLVATVTLIGFYVASRERKQGEKRRQVEDASRRADDAALLERLHLEIELNGQRITLQTAEHAAAALQAAGHAAAGLSATREAAAAATEAYHEANNANTKIAAVQQQLEERTNPRVSPA